MNKLCLFLLLPLQTIAHGVNMHGFETLNRDLFCTDLHDYDWHFQLASDLGFNKVRIPFSYQFVFENDYTKMDKLFESAHKYNFSIVLDLHRLDNYQQSPRPYNNLITLDKVISEWQVIISRYTRYKNLIALELFNEYQGNDPVEWNALVTKMIVGIESSFPGRFTYYVGGIVWGSQLQGVHVDLPFPGRIVYVIHRYWWSDVVEPFEAGWDKAFGTSNRSLIVVGEFGYKSTDNYQTAWVHRFLRWMQTQNITHTFFWTWQGGYSGDTEGILLDDCTNIDHAKISLLNDYWNQSTPPRTRNQSTPSLIGLRPHNLRKVLD